MADLLQRSLGPTITIDTRFPLSLAPVMADANQLELALLNLAMNARDAMPDGGPIVISAQEETLEEDNPVGLQPGAYVCLSVADGGEGMSEDVLARAVEPFFTTKGVGKGTGLGLSMVQGLAEQSGGKLTIESEAGIGTSVQVWLPVAHVNREAARRFAPNRSEEATPQTPSLHIVAVDDDSLVLLNTAAMLEDLGHIVYQAGSGAEALQLMASHPVDLLLTDYAMPQMNGVQLAEAVRADRPDLPVLLATGFAELAAGEHTALPRLAKPFSQSDLARAIAQLACPAAEGRVIPFRAR
jgi:CheY-like chemotaxis protein